MSSSNFSPKQKMAILLETSNIFVTDEYLVAQGNINHIGKIVESLVVEFEQASFEEYLSGSESPTTALQYRLVALRFKFLHTTK